MLVPAAADAPDQPGVYRFLDADGGLLYVGKAARLDRRLREHAHGDPTRPWLLARFEAVHAVQWETFADEDAAYAREADLIVFLRPPLNGSHTDQDPRVFLTMREVEQERVTFSLTANAESAPGAYGVFPHLAKGSAGHTAKCTKAGYAALQRLLWAAQAEPRARVPSRLGGDSPAPSCELSVARAHRRPLHDFLAGRSVRLLRVLQDAVEERTRAEFMGSALARDAIAANDFFELAPKRLATFRRVHTLPNGPVDADDYARLLAVEIGVAAPPPITSRLRRRGGRERPL